MRDQRDVDLAREYYERTLGACGHIGYVKTVEGPDRECGECQERRILAAIAEARREVEQALQNLMAVVNRDGGHRAAKFDTIKEAAADCEKNFHAEVAKARIEGARDAGVAIVKRCCPDCCEHCYNTALEVQQIAADEYRRGRIEGALEMRERTHAAMATLKHDSVDAGRRIRALPDEPEVGS